MKKLLSLLLAIALVFTSIPAQAFAAEQPGPTEGVNTGIEENKSYLVPLYFYASDGESRQDYPSSGGITEFVNDVAVVSKNADNTYHVTLQMKNYEKIEILQVSKPGAISDEIKPGDALYGTYNLPSSYIFEKDTAEDVRNAIAGHLNEEWNDKYIQNPEIQTTETGATFYSFDTETLEKSVYVKTFRSYEYKKYRRTWTYNFAFDAGKFTFDLSQAKVIPELNNENYKNVGIEIARVSSVAGEPVDFYSYPAAAAEINEYFSGKTTVKIVDQKIEVSTELKNADKIASVQVLNGITDLGNKSNAQPPFYAENNGFKQYKYAYPAEELDGKKISIYSENILAGLNLSVNFASLNEAIFGKVIKVQTKDGKTYYGELRLKNAPNKELRLTDGGVTVLTDSYNVGSENPEFKAELLEENSDENSEYNKYYSLLAGNASKALIYKLNINANGKTVKPTRATELRIKIPEGWDTSKIEVKWYAAPVYQIFNPIEYFGNSSYKNEDGSVRMEGDELVITGTTCVYNTLAITEKADKANIAEIKDGLYKVNVTMWVENSIPDPYGVNGGQLSMSNSVIKSNSAYIKVENGKKFVSFETQPVKIGNALGYSNGIFVANNEFDGPLFDENYEQNKHILNTFNPLNYYSYHLDKNGSTDMDGYAKDYNLYYPKRVGFELPASADRDNGAFLQFYVPIMDELQGKVPGSGEGNRVAFMTLSGLEAVSETMEAEYDSSILRVALDKVAKYKAEDYTDDSFKPLADAKAKAEKIIKGEITATGAEIIALDKEIADAALKLAPVVKHKVTVESGEGTGDYGVGKTVTIKANAAPQGQEFDKWTTNDGVTFENANNAETTFVMPDKAVTVKATYKNVVVPPTPEPTPGETIAEGKYIADATMLQENKDDLSMCNIMFDGKADIEVKGEEATLKLLVANPVPGFADQGADGTVKNVKITYNGTQYEAKSQLGTDAKMTAKDSNKAFGFVKGEKYPAQVLTVTLPKAAIKEGAILKTDCYVNVVMNSDVVFRIKLTNIVKDESGDVTPEPPVVPVPPVEPEKPAPEVVKPNVPTIPDQGADLGMTEEQQTETDKTIGDIIADIIKPEVKPEPPVDPEKPVPPMTEAEKETAATEEKIAEAAKNNEQVKVNVETEKVEEEKAPEAIKKEITEIKDKVKEIYSEVGGKLLQFANIEVTATAVKADGTTTDLGNLRNLDKKLSFTFQLPMDTEGDKFGVIRYHDGKAEIIPASDVTYDPVTKKITFLTDKFSTYAVFAYDKEPEVTPVPPVRPAKVQNLKVRTDYGLLKVTFDKSKEDVELYRIAVRKHGDKAWRYYETKNNSLIIKKLNGKALVKSARYDVMVAAVKDKAENIRSYYTKVKTVYANKSGVKAYKMYSPKFESIKRYNSGKTKVVVRNVKYTGETYQVAFRVKGTKTWKNTHYSTRTVRYITGLKKGKTYQFKVNYRYKSKLDGKTYVYSNSVYKYATLR